MSFVAVLIPWVRPSDKFEELKTLIYWNHVEHLSYLNTECMHLMIIDSEDPVIANANKWSRFAWSRKQKRTLI